MLSVREVIYALKTTCVVVTRSPHSNACNLGQCCLGKIVKCKQVKRERCATALPLAEVEEGHQGKAFGVTKEGVIQQTEK